MKMREDFFFVDELVPSIRWDAKYATWDNLTGQPVDGYLANRIVGSRALCAALEGARERADSLGFGLLLWDGYRPQRAVDCFLRWSKQPEDGKTKLRHYPNIERSEIVDQGYVATKSGHSRGSAVDITLFQLATGSLVPMGGGHDLMDTVSHHGAQGISPVEAGNRRTLCSIMEASGFNPYDREWWHYSLKDEPYPITYFDFPITSLVGQNLGRRVSGQVAALFGTSGVDTVMCEGMPDTPSARWDVCTTADVSRSGMGWVSTTAVRGTRALFGI